MIDGGSSSVLEVGKYRIVPYLKWRGIKKIDFLFITHSDIDHTSGIQELVERKGLGMEIGCIVLPHITKKDVAYIELENKCRKAGVPVVKMKQDDGITIGKLKLTCLHPQENYDWKTENDYSLVLKVDYEKLSLLMTGDLEADGEAASMDEFGQTYVLKVGHHGSKTSTSKQFVERLSPKIALISAGENNQYGHPGKETLKTLAEAKVSVLTTISSGAITFRGDGESFRIHTYKKSLEKQSQSG